MDVHNLSQCKALFVLLRERPGLLRVTSPPAQLACYYGHCSNHSNNGKVNILAARLLSRCKSLVLRVFKTGLPAQMGARMLQAVAAVAFFAAAAESMSCDMASRIASRSVA